VPEALDSPFVVKVVEIGLGRFFDDLFCLDDVPAMELDGTFRAGW
jgi:hypothetical protein